jgi:hypothetical protein
VDTHRVSSCGFLSWHWPIRKGVGDRNAVIPPDNLLFSRATLDDVLLCIGLPVLCAGGCALSGFLSQLLGFLIFNGNGESWVDPNCQGRGCPYGISDEEKHNSWVESYKDGMSARRLIVIIIGLGALGGGVLGGVLGIVVLLMIRLNVLRGRPLVYRYMIVAIPVWFFPGVIGAFCRSRAGFAVDALRYSAIMGWAGDLIGTSACGLCVMALSLLWHLIDLI